MDFSNIQTVNIGSSAHIEKKLFRSESADNSLSEPRINNILNYVTIGLISGGAAGGVFANQHAYPWLILLPKDRNYYGFNLTKFSKQDINMVVKALKSRYISIKVQKIIFGQKLIPPYPYGRGRITQDPAKYLAA